MILFVFNFYRSSIDWGMKVVHSAHLCHLSQYLSDRHIEKKKDRKGKDKEIQIVNKKENMITLLSLFSRRFPTKFLLVTGIAEGRLILEPITVKQTTRYNIVCSSIQRPRVKVYRSYRTYQPNTVQLSHFGILRILFFPAD